MAVTDAADADTGHKIEVSPSVLINQRATGSLRHCQS
jgi:hypothetical protein